MRRRKGPARDAVGQRDLFTGEVLRGPENISERMQGMGLISKRSGKTNVLKGVEKAAERIRGMPGVNINYLLDALRAETLDVDAVMKAAVAPIKRSEAEEKGVGRAIARIVEIVRRKRAADFWRREYSPGAAEYSEGARQRKHLRSIGKE